MPICLGNLSWGPYSGIEQLSWPDASLLKALVREEYCWQTK